MPFKSSLNAVRLVWENKGRNSFVRHGRSPLHLVGNSPVQGQDERRSAPAPITQRQLQVLRAIEFSIAIHGWPPSLSELCVMLQVSSKPAIVEHLGALQRKGYIRRDAGERRGIQVLVKSCDAVVSDVKSCRKPVFCDRCRKVVG